MCYDVLSLVFMHYSEYAFSIVCSIVCSLEEYNFHVIKKRAKIYDFTLHYLVVLNYSRKQAYGHWARLLLVIP